MADKEVYCAFDHMDSFPRNAPSRHCGTLQCKRTDIRNEYGDLNRLVIEDGTSMKSEQVWLIASTCCVNI